MNEELRDRIAEKLFGRERDLEDANGYVDWVHVVNVVMQEVGMPWFAATQIPALKVERSDMRIARLQGQVADLEAENAALWAFVQAEDAWNDHAESEDWGQDDKLYVLMREARETLRQYEDGGGR
jgi:hypothetical protein